MRRQLLRQHVRDVVVRANVRHHQLHRLDHVADVEVAALDVFAAAVVLGVVRKVPSALVISRAARGPRRSLPEACEKFTEVN